MNNLWASVSDHVSPGFCSSAVLLIRFRSSSPSDLRHVGTRFSPSLSQSIDGAVLSQSRDGTVFFKRVI